MRRLEYPIATLLLLSSSLLICDRASCGTTHQFNSARQSSQAAARSLSRARAKLKGVAIQGKRPGASTFPKKTPRSIPWSEVAATLTAIGEAEEKLAQVDKKIEHLQGIAETLQEEKAKLQTVNTSLESREKLFSMGFYTSLATAFLAGLALIIRVPTSRVEHRIKELELEKLRLELECAKTEKV